jgi:hypothetical protein|tara:strand:- start:2726 stop:2899 length:174 start_codon:yes stop_codon:yes gene_type:complete
MKDTLIETTYDRERYLVPYKLMGSWLAHIRGLSFFEKDCGHKEIAFSDAFSKYKVRD